MSVELDLFCEYIPNPDAEDADAVCEQQDLAEAGDLDLDGTVVNDDGVAIFEPARQAAIVCTIPGDAPPPVLFTIVGKDEFGNAQTVVVEYTAATSQSITAQYWSEISSISCSGAVDDVTVGNDASFAVVISNSRARLKGVNYVQDGTSTKTLEIKNGGAVQFRCDLVGKSGIQDAADSFAVIYIPQNGILFDENMVIYGEVGDFYSVNVFYQR